VTEERRVGLVHGGRLLRRAEHGSPHDRQRGTYGRARQAHESQGKERSSLQHLVPASHLLRRRPPPFFFVFFFSFRFHLIFFFFFQKTLPAVVPVLVRCRCRASLSPVGGLVGWVGARALQQHARCRSDGRLPVEAEGEQRQQEEEEEEERPWPRGLLLLALVPEAASASDASFCPATRQRQR
jgi:hypothetical protein